MSKTKKTVVKNLSIVFKGKGAEEGEKIVRNLLLKALSKIKALSGEIFRRFFLACTGFKLCTASFSLNQLKFLAISIRKASD